MDGFATVRLRTLRACANGNETEAPLGKSDWGYVRLFDLTGVSRALRCLHEHDGRPAEYVLLKAHL